jgi:hypothetical protein
MGNDTYNIDVSSVKLVCASGFEGDMKLVAGDKNGRKIGNSEYNNG